MELTPELYNALKASLSNNEKIIFGYPLGPKTMAGFDNLNDIPFDPDADAVDVIIKRYDLNNKPTTVELAGTFTIVPSKFKKEPVPKYGKIKLSELRKRAEEWRREDMRFYGPTAYNDTDMEYKLVEFAEMIVDIDRDENVSEESSGGNNEG